MSDQYHPIYNRTWKDTIRSETASFDHRGDPETTLTECLQTCNRAFDRLLKVRGPYFRGRRPTMFQDSTRKYLESELKEALEKGIRLEKLPSCSHITVSASSAYVNRFSEENVPGLNAVYPQIDFTITVHDYTFTRSVDPWGPARAALINSAKKRYVEHGKVCDEDTRTIQWVDRDGPSVATSEELDYGGEEHESEDETSHPISRRHQDDESFHTPSKEAEQDGDDETDYPTDALMDLSLPGVSDSEDEEPYPPPDHDEQDAVADIPLDG